MEVGVDEGGVGVGVGMDPPPLHEREGVQCILDRTCPHMGRDQRVERLDVGPYPFLLHLVKKGQRFTSLSQTDKGFDHCVPR